MKHYLKPTDPQLGDKFVLHLGVLHLPGVVHHVEPADNAFGKPGFRVVWEDDKGVLRSTPWSTFRDGAEVLL